MNGGMIHELLDRAAMRDPAKVAVRAGQDGWSYAELAQWSRAVAEGLASTGLRRGERVAVMMGNRVEFVVVVDALSRLGCSTVLISPAWKAAEVRHALDLTRGRLAVADGDGVSLLSEMPGLDVVIDIDDWPPARWPAMSNAADPADGPVHEAAPTATPTAAVTAAVTAAPTAEAAPAATTEAAPTAAATATERMTERVDLDDEAVLVFSSGTTGMPKAVRHTHRSMGHAVRHWVDALRLGPSDRFQVATPPSHILGLLNLLCAVAAGATVRLHRRFDLDAVLDSIEADRLTLEMAVAPIALAMANHPSLESRDLSSLRYIMWGATPINASVAETVTTRTGVRWLAGYGASEVPVIACNPVERPECWRLDSVGLPPEGVELRVVDLVTGAEVAPGHSGEIQVRSPSVMAGYLPEAATAEVMDNGWYRTGDVGHLDADGWVHLTDRAKEMIKVKGFQVAPAEIEGVLHGHPAVLDCAVFGVAHPEAGEVPVAAVRLDPTVDLGHDELADLVAATLASYKRLHDVVVVEEIPRLPSGKVLRRELRARYG